MFHMEWFKEAIAHSQFQTDCKCLVIASICHTTVSIHCRPFALTWLPPSYIFWIVSVMVFFDYPHWIEVIFFSWTSDFSDVPCYENTRAVVQSWTLSDDPGFLGSGHTALLLPSPCSFHTVQFLLSPVATEMSCKNPGLGAFSWFNIPKCKEALDTSVCTLPWPLQINNFILLLRLFLTKK
jgi:hypothetical protein